MSCVPVLLHDGFKGPQEILLKAEIGQLALLQKLHGQLTQGIDGKEGNLLVRVTANAVEVLAQNLPNPAPLQPDAPHVVVGYLDDLLQTVHARTREGRELVAGDLAESLDEADDGVAVEVDRAGENSVDGYDHALRARLVDRLFHGRQFLLIADGAD